MKSYINASAVRKLVRQHGKRVSKDFLVMLNSHIERKVIACSKEHNGGRKTLDVAVATYYMN